MASLCLCAETGIPFRPEEKAAYINNWISVLKNDKNEFFKAASDAAAISDYLLGRARERNYVTRLEELRNQETTARSGVAL